MSREIFDFVLKLLLFSVTLYFICDFADKAQTINTHYSISAIMILTVVGGISFLLIRCK